MTKSFTLVYILALCSLQLSSLAQAQFLPSDSPVVTTDPTIAEFNENTPEEIQAAISRNLPQMFEAFGQFLIISTADTAGNPNQNALVNAFGNTLVDSAQPISDALGTLVADGVAAFRDAQATGGDVGAVVGGVVADALRELNNNAQAIADSVQQEFDAALATLENVPEDGATMIFAYAGEGVQRLINAVAIRADVIGGIVAQAVNDAVSQGGSIAEQLGHAAAGLVQAFEDHAEDVGDIVSEAMAGLEGANEERLAGVKSDVVAAIQAANISADEVGSEVTNMVDLASGDSLFGIPAQSVVEVIDRLGQLFLYGVAETA